ncbi:hypothetical protein [Glaciihabitans sp. UYNi722]|uniref:hypothetical protein n=1 Tax=Glaciihabitans sp. UYNi722 TaxID=3156344 RepID=UPI0033994B61
MSEPGDMKPSGSGYALVDWRLSKIEQKLDALGSTFVPIEIYSVNQQNITAEFARQMTAIADVKTAQAKFEADIEVNRKELEKNRKQFFLSVAGGALLLVLGIFVPAISKALGLG